MPTVLQYGSLNLLEPSRPVQACNGIALPFLTPNITVVSLHRSLHPLYNGCRALARWKIRPGLGVWPPTPPSLKINPLNAELNPICYLLALLAHHFRHVSRIRVKSLTLRLLMSYIYIYIYMEHLFLMFLHHIQRRSTVGRAPLDE